MLTSTTFNQTEFTSAKAAILEFESAAGNVLLQNQEPRLIVDNLIKQSKRESSTINGYIPDITVVAAALLSPDDIIFDYYAILEREKAELAEPTNLPALIADRLHQLEIGVENLPLEAYQRFHKITEIYQQARVEKASQRLKVDMWNLGGEATPLDIITILKKYPTDVLEHPENLDSFKRNLQKNLDAIVRNPDSNRKEALGKLQQFANFSENLYPVHEIASRYLEAAKNYLNDFDLLLTVQNQIYRIIHDGSKSDQLYLNAFDEYCKLEGDPKVAHPISDLIIYTDDLIKKGKYSGLNLKAQQLLDALLALYEITRVTKRIIAARIWGKPTITIVESWSDNWQDKTQEAMKALKNIAQYRLEPYISPDH